MDTPDEGTPTAVTNDTPEVAPKVTPAKPKRTQKKAEATPAIEPETKPEHDQRWSLGFHIMDN